MSQTAEVLLFVQPFEQWEAEGRALGDRERSGRALPWDIGDWWNRGTPYGERVKIVQMPDWTGPKHATCWEDGRIAKRWEASKRFEGLEWWHHQIVAALPDEQAIPLLEWCRDANEAPTAQQLRTRIQQLRRAEREEELADKIEQAAIGVGHQVYGVLYADPPWRLEPYSRETGLNRAADNHYPTMTRDDLFDMEAMRSAPAKDCVLFCWATVPMLEDALEWMAEYGFSYRSHCVWVKDRPGTGYWFRNQHELLLVGVRGEVPAPAPGTQFPSVMEAPVGRHSEKPPAAAAMIEALFPTVAKLELFARAPRAGWDTWGAEAECPTQNR